MRDVGPVSPNLSSFSSCFNQMSSQVAVAMERYSASALDLATTLCFLLLQEIKLSPTNTQYPEVDLLSIGEPAQSASEYPTTLVCLGIEKDRKSLEAIKVTCSTSKRIGKASRGKLYV
ncbi:uncharacterized protein LOC133297846 [Gastrolobium bilobum]|uniref:uncharacterized protein LOC133297846 n=1 Tax=Gastrolobium bilobum TaxID=150636 RepID=UPI002AAFF5C6|nr:uncharacterized protein LOC133297846 [Gastrolobium bilobum]